MYILPTEVPAYLGNMRSAFERSKFILKKYFNKIKNKNKTIRLIRKVTSELVQESQESCCMREMHTLGLG
jgi:hypothetical protein